MSSERYERMENSRIADTVRAAAGGDERAFEDLFHAYQDAMYSLVMHFVGDRELAADLTQDAFVRAWERLPSLREPEAFGGWLLSLVVNMVRDHFRRLRETEPLDDELTVSDGEPDFAESMSVTERERKVRQAVLALPEHQRTPVVMYHLEGRPVDEVAQALGVPKNTVVSRLSRGREALRRRLAAYLEAGES